MGRSGDTDDDPEEIWGTWEELLLACAVTRHGTSSWDSVAMEVQSRTAFSPHLLTPSKCRLRYLHLHRRFSPAADGEGEGEEGRVKGEDVESVDAGAWVEELRKIRVAELRREVERCDLSIVSLELKVSRLKEERERCQSDQDPCCNKDQTLDPTVENDPRHSKDENGSGGGGGRSPGSVAPEISGRSCKESNESNNSTDEKPEPAKLEPGTGAEGGTETGTDRNEPGESVAESKESSEVQSSASLSTRRRKAVGSASAISETESLPLIAFLEALRNDKSGAVFERRLASQQSETYQSTIKRHMDLEMIRTKLETTGSNSETYTSATEFYRDLLLLCANALVFFPSLSQEHAAALHLRSLITKQINTAGPLKPHGSSSSSHKEVKLKDLPKPKTESDVGGLLLEKPAIIVCRKRSSLAKPAPAPVGNSANSVVEEEKQEKVPASNSDPNPKKTTSTRGPRTSKTRSNTTLLASSVKSQKQSSDKGSDKSVATSENVPKKRNAADFLKRLKDNPSSTSSKASNGDTGKKVKSDNRRDHSSSRKQTTPPGKRNVGRPPKRSGSSVTPPPAKRLKEEPAKPPPASKRRRNR